MVGNVKQRDDVKINTFFQHANYGRAHFPVCARDALDGRRVTGRFRFGAWLVDPSTNAIETADEKRQMEPRTMEVLVALCKARGAILSADELLTQCWGSTISGDSPLHKAIAQLRRVLGDSASKPLYIETLRMRGYRTVGPLDFSARTEARGSWQAGSPFRGLLAFDADHADVFFGRDDVTRKLVEAAGAQAASGLALLLILGPSGSGKTSLVQAGLLPALSSASTPPGLCLLASTGFDLFDQGEHSLFTALAGTLLDLQWEDRWAFPGENAMSLGARLEHGCADVIAELHAALAPHAQGRPGLRFGVFIDRFEALFNATRIAETERDAFLHTLEQLARSGAAFVIVACRNDFYPSIARYPLLTQGKRHGGHCDLEPPGFGDIAQMIRRPAAAAKLSFGTDPVTGAGLDDILCASAAGRPDALPLLQYCLQELYRLRTGEGELSFEAFRQLGDLEGAIGQRAEAVVLGLDDAQRAALAHIMSLVIILSSDGANVSSQRAPWAALRDDAARQAVAALIESRLFVSDLAGGTPVFGIAHDAILRRWPRMTDWIAAHRSALVARGRLAQHAGRWCDEGRPADLLLPQGKLLEEAKELQQAGVWSLTAREGELILASNRRVRQRDRLRMCALALIVALALLAVGLGVSAQLAKQAAESRRREAESLMDFMLGDFADKLRPLGRLDFLESVSGQALQYLSGSDRADLSPAALTLRAKGLQIIGEVSRSRGDSKQALDALTKARAILMRQLLMAPRDLQVLKNLGANAYWLAQIHKDQNDWQAAEDALRDYLKYADLLNQLDPANPEWWVEQSYAHNNLGALAQTRGKPELAAPEFMASIALKRRALERTPDSASVAAELADSYSWLASAKETLGELAAAETLYAQEMELVQRLRARFPGESMWIYREVRALQHRALVGLALGMDARALSDYDEARRLFKPIVDQDRKNLAWQVELSNLEQEQLRIMARRAGAGALLPQLVAVHRGLQAVLAMDPKNASWARREALSRTRVAAALMATGRAKEAEQEIDAALLRLQALYASNPSDLSGRLALIDVLLLPSTLQQPAKNYTPSMLLNCSQAYGMIRNEGPTTLNYQILDPWVRVNFCLQHQAQAKTGARRLQEIGYRDASFAQFMSTR
jgi:DNA-binding winged helix-turn-helix (wHTH) protein/tetratricopeptide (TPR) repeat protein